ILRSDHLSRTRQTSPPGKRGEADQQTIRNRCLPPPAPVTVNQSRKPTPAKVQNQPGQNAQAA
ncbi:MAG: hypothetical protein KGQ89_09035, partial [Verrucomicrobia bacterium]|nr:hypothetical protein [Verrucomicrobiota bacterium]